MPGGAVPTAAASVVCVRRCRLWPNDAERKCRLTYDLPGDSLLWWTQPVLVFTTKPARPMLQQMLAPHACAVAGSVGVQQQWCARAVQTCYLVPDDVRNALQC